MRILFWNVRGLGKANRRSWVKEHILTEDLDIVAIQETIKQDFIDIELKELSGNTDFNWLWVPARGHLGGSLLGFGLMS
jgi:exonuclease III